MNMLAQSPSNTGYASTDLSNLNEGLPRPAGPRSPHPHPHPIPTPLLLCRHTSRFLMIWLTCLPFALYSTCGLGTIPLVFLIAFLLLGEDRWALLSIRAGTCFWQPA